MQRVGGLAHVARENAMVYPYVTNRSRVVFKGELFVANR